MIVQKLSEQKGFSLVEMMVAVCIMAIAFAGLATMEIACINGNAIASNVTMGITLAQDKMEELNSVDYNDPQVADVNTGNNGTLRSTTNIDFSEIDIDEQGDEKRRNDGFQYLPHKTESPASSTGPGRKLSRRFQRVVQLVSHLSFLSMGFRLDIGRPLGCPISSRKC